MNRRALYLTNLELPRTTQIYFDVENKENRSTALFISRKIKKIENK